MAVQTQIQARRGTAATWTSTNPTLAAGEMGFETDTGKFKIGTGSAAWTALGYAGGGQNTLSTYVYTATSGQTTFSGADSNGNTLSYTVGAIQVYLNGALLTPTSDFTASTGTSVVLVTGALTSDTLTVLALGSFTVSTDIAKSTLSTKGDILTATAASTPAVLAVGADGSSIVADSSTSTGLRYQGSMAAGRNFIINGGFDIWQRGTSVAAQQVGFNYVSDRWGGSSNTSGAATVSRQVTGDTTNLPFVQYCARYQRTAGNTATGIQYLNQPIETINSIPLVGKTVTVSFYARAGANFSATSNALNVSLRSGTGTDQNYLGTWTGDAVVASTTATLTTTWQRFQFTGTVGATATELTLPFTYTPTGTAGANDYYEVTGVQLEVGSVATQFSRAGATIQGELAACQRYYFRDVVVQTNTAGFAVGYMDSATNFRFVLPMPVTMRGAPSLAFSAAADLRAASATGSFIASAYTLYGVTSNGVYAGITISGATAGQGGTLNASTTTAAYIELSAEL